MTDPYALLIVGGGPAGLSAARGYRDAGGDGGVAIVTDEYRMPYQRPPLTKELLRGEATEAALPLEDEAWLAQNGVSLVGGRAVALDADARTITLSGSRGLAYRQCVLTTGAEPTRLPVPGSDDPAVRVVRTLDHVRDLLSRLGDAGRVVVIGSGFIGCEIASSLRARGQRVALVSDEPAPNVRRLGDEAGAIIGGWLADDGVETHLGVAVERIDRSSGGVLEVVAGTERVPAELVVMAAGVAPRSELASQAGLALHDGAIPVGASMRTACDGLLAAGDVCIAENAAAGRPLRVEHWGDALAQGEIAGRSAAGDDDARWEQVPGFWSTIGSRTLKYAAWGDGYSDFRLGRRGDGFTVWYGRDGKLVGVLAHQADEDYERGSELIEQGAAWRP